MIPGAPRLDRDEVPATRPHRGHRTRVLLVRHGVTPFTEQSRLDGRGGADPSLSPTGRAQALRAAEIVTQLLRTGEGRGTAPARLVTSDLARARQTGAVLAEHVRPILAARAAQGPHVGAREEQFVPYPATWLNQRRWEDEITADGMPAGERPLDRSWAKNGPVFRDDD